MTVETADWVGYVLAGGRYRVTAKLGAGGMGHVYKVWDQHLSCDAVIKVPRADLLEDAEFVGRFTREVRSLVKLAHPHIVKILDVGEHDGVPFLVLQFLSGGTLRDRQPSDPNGRPLPMAPANRPAGCPTWPAPWTSSISSTASIAMSSRRTSSSTRTAMSS
jgi:serine/threonine protein kinase